MATRKTKAEAPSTPKTIKLVDHLRASAAIYDRELERYDELTDDELARVLSIASDDTVARVLSIASAGTVARVLRIASDSTVARVLSIASAGTVARVLSIASDSTVDRVSLDVPIVENLDQRMYEVTKAGKLDMTQWHCNTTHCRAGWAITFAGAAGAALEKAVGPELAGRYIYEASTGRIAPNFYANTSDAAKDIARCAGVEG